MPSQTFFDNPNLTTGDVTAEMSRALDEAARQTLTRYQRTTATWNHKPAFETDKEPTARVVGTNDRIYEIVSETGSRPHTIRPRRTGGRLRFQTGYRAKTRRGVIGSTSGGASGDVVFSRGVQHPGFEAREFSQAITVEVEPILEREVNEALRRLHG